jgi:uncharacterized membrane protein AbrB (regulator of aidB expression)
VFGPLPRLHQLLVVLTTLAVGIASGIWLTQFSTVPTAAVAGACWGAAAGLSLSYLLLHDFHHRPRPVRVRRH